MSATAGTTPGRPSKKGSPEKKSSGKEEALSIPSPSETPALPAQIEIHTPPSIPAPRPPPASHGEEPEVRIRIPEPKQPNQPLSAGSKQATQAANDFLQMLRNAQQPLGNIQPQPGFMMMPQMSRPVNPDADEYIQYEGSRRNRPAVQSVSHVPVGQKLTFPADVVGKLVIGIAIGGLLLGYFAGAGGFGFIGGLFSSKGGKDKVGKGGGKAEVVEVVPE